MKDTKTDASGQLVYDIVADVKFAFDSTRNGAIRWNWKYREWKHVVDGVTKSAPEDFPTAWASGMIKDGAFYSVSQGPMAARPQSSIKPSTKFNYNPWTSDFDPLFFIGGRGNTTGMMMKWYFDNARVPELEKWEVSKAGTFVTMDCQRGPVLARYVADLSEGGLLVEQSSSSVGTQETITDKTTFRHKKVGEVWVTDGYQYEHSTTMPENKSYATRRVVEFKTLVVNEPLSDAEFELPALGIKEGDEIFDTRSRVKTTYHGSDAPDPTPAQASPAPPSNTPRQENLPHQEKPVSSSFRSVLIIGNVALAFVAVSFFAVKWARRRWAGNAKTSQ